MKAPIGAVKVLHTRDTMMVQGRLLGLMPLLLLVGTGAQNPCPTDPANEVSTIGASNFVLPAADENDDANPAELTTARDV